MNNDNDNVLDEDHLREFHQPLELLLYERISVARWLVKAEMSENDENTDRSIINNNEEDDDNDKSVSNKDDTKQEQNRRNNTFQRMHTIRTEMRDEARLLSVVISAITKLASHQTDLSPRVLLCLTKIVSKDARSSFHESVIRRARESMRLLEYPSTFSMLGQFDGENDGLLRKIRSDRVDSVLHSFGS